MDSSSLTNTYTGFKERLEFFRNQVEKDNVSASATSTNKTMKDYSKAQVASVPEIKLKTSSNVPTVDNILSKVKNLCSSLNSTETHSNRNFTQVNKNKYSTHQTSNSVSCPNSIVVTRSDQVSPLSIFPRNEPAKKSSLLSNFKPCLDDESYDVAPIKNTSLESASVGLKVPFSHFDPKDSSEKDFQKTQPCGLFAFPNVAPSPLAKLSASNLNPNTALKYSQGDPIQNILGDTSGIKKEKYGPFEHQNVCSSFLDERPAQATKTDVFSAGSENTSEPTVSKNYLDSDYDSQDFIVHKATFPEDYAEEMSEDNYGSIHEDCEYEQSGDRDLPSPDYCSDEEKYIVEPGDSEEYEVEFVENSSQYVTEPRQYIYCSENKELDVIPEEDEDFLEEEDTFCYDDTFKTGRYRSLTQNSEINHGECDSGLTDDQRSNSSTGEECDFEEDTDSAKGSLPLQDSGNESLTCYENPNMFQNVEYHKQKKRSPRTTSCDTKKNIILDRNLILNKNVIPDEEQNDLQPGIVTSSWHPKELLEVLYRLDFPKTFQKKQTRYINKEGYLEKLPSGRKKATYWNPWKKRYIRLRDGYLLCFDNIHAEKPSITRQIMGAHVDILDNKMIGVDDQKGHYIVLKCSHEEDVDSWKEALLSHCVNDFVSTYTSPSLYPLPLNKHILIVDIGSCSIRAGILMSTPSLPQLFFPSVCASDKKSNKKIFGFDALNPHIRKHSYLTFPFHPSAKVTKYSIDVSLLPELLKHICQELNIYPEDYKVHLIMPRSLNLQTKIKIAHMLLDDFGVKGLNLTHQAISAFHAYNSKSGIIVDIGDRLDVVPIVEGYIIESGVTRLPYGGQRMIHHLKHALAEKNICLISDVETLLSRYVLEQLCYVAEDYYAEMKRYQTHPEDFEMSISTSHLFNDQCPWEEIILDMGRFHITEGLFTPETWGLDNPGLHKLVYHAIQESGVDVRKEMTKSIYVSGGITLLPGFVERLELEIDKLTPNTITPKVHASPYRYHISYIGACQIALEEKFDDIWITRSIWRKEKNSCVKKWHV